MAVKIQHGGAEVYEEKPGKEGIVDFAKLILLAIETSVFLLVLSLGLQVWWGEATFLFKRPRRLATSMLAMYVILPVFAAGLAAAFKLDPAVKIALVLLAVSPVQPLLPKRQLDLHGRKSYIYGLLVAAAVLAIVVVPLSVEVLGAVFKKDVYVAVADIARVVLATVLAPLGAGIALQQVEPELAKRAAPIAYRMGAVLLIIGVIPILFVAWPAVISLIGNGTVIAIIAFIVMGLAVGHTMGGPNQGDRATLALATASRHPGVAITIAQSNFPGRKPVLAAVLLYLVLNAIVSAAYAMWCKRRQVAVKSWSKPGTGPRRAA